MLYNRHDFKDNCGFGLIANLTGEASHKVVRTAILGLSRMQHRGAILADGKTGDGCGLLLQLPRRFFHAVAGESQINLGEHFAVGMIFFPRDVRLAKKFAQIITEELINETLTIALWRNVPLNPEVLGPIARNELPVIKQILINTPAGWQTKDMERRLFIARRRIEKRINHPDFYICSLSNQVLVYKGLCMPADLPKFYLDLADLRLQSAICLFHQRFSTNTLPRWQLAQPFRYLAHNGEINTIAANRAWAAARAYKYRTPLIPDLPTAAPFVNNNGSDSSALDNMFELFVNGGMDIFRAMRLLIPPAWQHNPDLNEDLKAFYNFNSMHMEPWDGPAGVVFSDGRFAACTLDRNGLRPARYVITADKLITVASEVGIWDYAPDEVLAKGRVGPGELLVIDTEEGKLLTSAAIDNDIKNRHPYKEWLHRNVLTLTPGEDLGAEASGTATFTPHLLKNYQKEFMYTLEELENVLRVLGENGQEAIGSMGDDTPLAVLSTRPRVIYDYFRQFFAQVTNPPIDPLREAHVMSLATSLGKEMSVFYETEGMSHRVNLSSPVLLYSDMEQLLNLPADHYKHHFLDATFAVNTSGLKTRLTELADEAVAAVKAGAVILLISDRGINPERAALPAPLTVGLIQERLTAANLRCDANIIVITGSARDPHQFAVLISLGATAVYPYLAYESLAAMIKSGAVKQSLRQVTLNYRNGINKGLYKIISKMGIATIASYRCARLFEVIGLGADITDTSLAHMVSRIGGMDFSLLTTKLLDTHQDAFNDGIPLDIGGLLKFKYQGEYHAYNPETVNLLQRAVNSGKFTDYERFRDAVNTRAPLALRDLLRLKSKEGTAIPIGEVEPAAGLYRRFDSAAMSIGALSPEAHEAIAVAMNRLGGFSNSGEGGEDPKRYNTDKVSRIKQVASGRFGVTPAYLMSAEVIQIKVAQGAKPGEGGQLPGSKVTPYIAGLRFAVPGATLISPPPHHDIYSIEDLAQLIFDLKQINPKATVSVKLVSLPGVGTIAGGVAKAYADLITISGYDGGTGASPLTSVKYAGSPWELGLAEAQQALVSNGQRHKVRLQTDGGLKTGMDIVKAAILGAESFGFGTAPMVALGCRYLRICHLNNCATGVATQDDTLRQKHFHGLPERVMNYFKFLAEDVRLIMASLGIKRLVDLIGRTDLLERIPGITPAQQLLDLNKLLAIPTAAGTDLPYQSASNPPFDCGRLNQEIVQVCTDAVKSQRSMTADFTISNVDRSVGAALSGIIAARYGNSGRRGQTFTLNFTGTAGQSFGVWLAGGIRLVLTGDANDYVGKGMAGGEIIIKPPVGTHFKSNEAVIIGNTCLYGATGGALYASGCAGERFAVRNSGAVTVVEGIGDNGCEYMTGGVVCVLGKTGNNFGAGMTGGLAYILDHDGAFKQRLNPQFIETVSLARIPAHQEYLRGLIARHIELTRSTLGTEILADWRNYLCRFVLVKPKTALLTDLLSHRQLAETTRKTAAS